MALQAQLQFVQGITTFTAGQSAFVTSGTSVTAKDAINSGAGFLWQFETLDTPPTSIIPPTGIQQAFSTTNNYVFTPDVPGCFFLQMTVKNVATQEIAVSTVEYDSQFGSGSGNIACVKTTTNRIYPAYGAVGRHYNFLGNVRGWNPAIETWFAFLDTLTGGGGGSGTQVIVTANASIASGDRFVVVAPSPAAVVTVTLTAPLTVGQTHTIDGPSNASSFNVIVNGGPNTIDGSATYTIAIDYGSVTVRWNGTEFRVI